MNIRQFLMLVCICLLPQVGLAQGQINRPGQRQSHNLPSKETVKAKSGSHNGHEWVDLGLPSGTKWAVTNIGANNPWEYGIYFSWGEPTPESINSYKNSELNKGIDAFQGDIKHDAAKNIWGGNWCMPTKQNFNEMLTHCKINWSEVNGYIGISVKGPNGNSIFFPAAGMKCEKKYHWDPDEYGAYWSATPDGDWGFMFLFTKYGSASGIHIHSCGTGFATPIRAILTK